MTTKATPTKVMAYIGIASALYDFRFEVTGFFSGETLEKVDPKTIAPNLPFDRMTNLDYGDGIDVETILGLGTELFVGANYDVTGSSQTIWPIPQDVVEQIAKVAGVIAVAYADGTDAARLIQTNESLAAALGADVTCGDVASTKDTFKASEQALRDAVAAKPGFRALFMTGAPDGFYVGRNLADLNLYTGAGLEIVGVEGYDIQSWETFPAVDAGAIFVDNRATGWLQPEEMKAQIPTWPLHLAVRLGRCIRGRTNTCQVTRGSRRYLRGSLPWLPQRKFFPDRSSRHNDGGLLGVRRFAFGLLPDLAGRRVADLRGYLRGLTLTQERAVISGASDDHHPNWKGRVSTAIRTSASAASLPENPPNLRVARMASYRGSHT